MSKELADLLFPAINTGTEEIISIYPPRKLGEKAMVTRIAPSPTGDLHIGSLYAAFISYRLAAQSNGVFYIRLEDTDGKREVEGAAERIIKELRACGIIAAEGCQEDGTQKGSYGPYVQSERRLIYQAFAKDLVRKGLAYPCFCDKSGLDFIRSAQKDIRADIGYYGEWAKCRVLTLADIQNNIRNKIPYVIRIHLRNCPEKIIYEDLFKGRLEFPAENKDTIIIKTDGLPTYHFAHCIDDTLMGTTHVLRGDEWLASLPVHRQLFQALGFAQPVYGHIAPIVKIDGNVKRKYSKRKDIDGLASYFLSNGYPVDGLHEYFLTLANSNFEQWRTDNPSAGSSEYKIDISRLSASGAVFNKDKLLNICRNIVAGYSTDKVYEYVRSWAEKYDPELFGFMRDEHYAKAILSLGRGMSKPRKDIDIYSNIKNLFGYFFDEFFLRQELITIPGALSIGDAKNFLHAYLSSYRHSDSKEEWFFRLRHTASEAGFCADMKEYKKNKGAYIGSISDAACVVRTALTNKTESPDLYDIQQIMGENRVKRRIGNYLHYLCNI